ncbi:MAG: replication factor C small subunit [Thermoplasmata archaeon]|nr:replication factor C small subunit [Thermoplasmata archaeon]
MGEPSHAVWVEKYRPQHLADMVGQPSITPLLAAYAAQKTLPHLMFAGPPGTGKTTAALALARDLFGPDWRDNFLELNASDERGIDTVRTKIKEYARIAPFGVGFKLLFLDEADNLTAEAQASLRRLMERYSGSCRFILSCNYSSRVIEPIQSRCAVFRFKPHSPAATRVQLERIATAEVKKVDPLAFDAIVSVSEGDLRRAINLLQLAATYTDHVTEQTVKDVSTVPLETDVDALFSEAVQHRFLDARRRLLSIFAERGASGEEVLRAMHRFVVSPPAGRLTPDEQISLIEYLGEIDFRLAQGASERIQLEAVLAHLAAMRLPAARP